MLVVVLLLLFLNTEFHSLVHARNCTWIVNYHVRILLRIHCRDGYWYYITRNRINIESFNIFYKKKNK